jgi:hypothetical protein
MVNECLSSVWREKKKRRGREVGWEVYKVIAVSEILMPT